MRPTLDRLLIEPIPDKEKTSAGLIIPEMAKRKPTSGTVLAIGEGRKDEPILCKVGDKVMFNENAGYPLVYEEKEVNDVLSD